MQLNFVVRQGNSAITLSFVNLSPMGEGFQLLETLLQLHKLCSYIICSIKYTCTIFQFTQKIPHTRSCSPSRLHFFPCNYYPDTYKLKKHLFFYMYKFCQSYIFIEEKYVKNYQSLFLLFDFITPSLFSFL